MFLCVRTRVHLYSHLCTCCRDHFAGVCSFLPSCVSQAELSETWLQGPLCWASHWPSCFCYSPVTSHFSGIRSRFLSLPWSPLDLSLLLLPFSFWVTFHSSHWARATQLSEKAFRCVLSFGGNACHWPDSVPCLEPWPEIVLCLLSATQWKWTAALLFASGSFSLHSSQSAAPCLCVVGSPSLRLSCEKARPLPCPSS